MFYVRYIGYTITDIENPVISRFFIAMSEFESGIQDSRFQPLKIRTLHGQAPKEQFDVFKEWKWAPRAKANLHVVRSAESLKLVTMIVFLKTNKGPALTYESGLKLAFFFEGCFSSHDNDTYLYSMGRFNQYWNIDVETHKTHFQGQLTHITTHKTNTQVSGKTTMR